MNDTKENVGKSIKIKLSVDTSEMDVALVRVGLLVDDLRKKFEELNASVQASLAVSKGFSEAVKSDE